MSGRKTVTRYGLVALAATLLSLTAATADNMVPDPEFADADFTPLTYESSWIWYQIVAPSEASLDQDAKTITLTGGKTFLHSPRFNVTAGGTYTVAVTAKGTGKVSIEVLWWRADGGTADPHRTIPVEPTALADEIKTVSATATAPDNAAEAYLRIVVEEGTLALSAPSAKAK